MGGDTLSSVRSMNPRFLCLAAGTRACVGDERGLELEERGDVGLLLLARAFPLLFREGERERGIVD